MTNTNRPNHLYVKTFARLHLGFLDLNGQSGRRFGSLGIGLSSPQTRIELAVGEGLFGLEPDYVQKHKHALLQHLGITGPCSIKVHQAIPRHSGLGSGTQMALAIGTGIAHLFKKPIALNEIASATNRGKRSGIGIGTFEQGGFVLDGGRGEKTALPPILMQHRFPESWRILLIYDRRDVGVHGQAELAAFSRLEDASVNETQRVNHAVMMHLLPGIKEQDYQRFSEGVALLQAYTGNYFAPEQGGQYASEHVGQVLNAITVNGVQCVGQSSWGPTGFAIFETPETASTIIEKITPLMQEKALEWELCEARNAGAEVNG